MKSKGGKRKESFPTIYRTPKHVLAAASRLRSVPETATGVRQARCKTPIGLWLEAAMSRARFLLCLDVL